MLQGPAIGCGAARDIEIDRFARFHRQLRIPQKGEPRNGVKRRFGLVPLDAGISNPASRNSVSHRRIDSEISEVSEFSENCIASVASRLAGPFIYHTDPSKLPVQCGARSRVGPLLAR
jgi:hypothetical protein